MTVTPWALAASREQQQHVDLDDPLHHAANAGGGSGGNRHRRRRRKRDRAKALIIRLVPSFLMKTRQQQQQLQGDWSEAYGDGGESAAESITGAGAGADLAQLGDANVLLNGR